MPIENSVSIEAGSTSVVGNVTQFVAAEGDLLIVNGITAVITAADSTSALTLAKPWPGPAVVEEVDWVILNIGPYWRSTVTTNTLVTELLRKIDGGLPLKPDAAGTLAERAAYDGQGEGFLFLQTDVDPFLLFVKTGPDAADWSEGQRLQADQAASTREAIASADRADQAAEATEAGRQAVETAAQAVEANRQAVDLAATAVESARQEVSTNTAAVADDAQAADLAAAAVEIARQEVATNTAAVADDAQAVEMARQEVADNAAAVADDKQAVDTTAIAVEEDRQEVAQNLTAFRNAYYGPLAVDPVTRPDGSAIQEGDVYTRTTAPKGLRIFLDGAWEAAAIDANGALLKASNLSDLPDPSAALVTLLGGSPLAGLRNKIINGGKSINQRGYAGGALTVGTYGFDRWKGHANGIEQIIEAAEVPADTYTLSWSGGGTGYVNANSGLSPLTVTLPGGANVSVVVPAAATNIQLEPGTEATAFERRHQALELLLCQRYYESSYGQGVAPGTAGAAGAGGMGVAISTTRMLCGTKWLVPKRTSAPSFVVFNPTTGAGASVLVPGVESVSINAAGGVGRTGFLYLDAGAGFTVGRAYLFHYTVSDEL